MKTKMIMLLAGCMLSSVTYAAQSSQKGDASLMKLSFSDMRTACQNPQKFHNQVAPSNIQISCRDVQTKWVPLEDGKLTMPNSRQVTGSLISDKYTSDSVTGNVDSTGQEASCSRFKQVYETVDTVRSVSCDELVAFTGTIVEFCSSAINALRASNPSAITTTDSGQTYDMCPTRGGQQGQMGQQGRPGQSGQVGRPGQTGDQSGRPAQDQSGRPAQDQTGQSGRPSQQDQSGQTGEQAGQGLPAEQGQQEQN